MSRHRTAALVGNPNSGKSALFNALTGARQKIANYPGVTVERKAGRLTLPSGESVELLDLPGSYSLDSASPDEEVTRQVVEGTFEGEKVPDVLVLVLDAANLEQHLVFAQEVLELGRPTVVALNMVDLAERDGLTLDPAALSAALGVAVVPTVAVRRKGIAELGQAIAEAERHADEDSQRQWHLTLPERRLSAKHIARGAILSKSARHTVENGVDRVLLNPWVGPVILFALLFVVFQAVFAWATPFADALEGVVGFLSGGAAALLPEGLVRDFVTEGVLAGVGSVVVFLPQIVILFFFIL
ncbi:MAG: 50S ribosome-binding GTPase, partial [Alphaproteobacteria bacterium]|nr:50S ribosome-binding GTPase [Alphaproteobacteria bacterium]